MESDRIVRFTSGIFQPTVLLQTDVSTTGQDGHTHLTHHRTELLDLRSIEAKVNHEIGKRNLSANLIHSNNDISATLRQRKGQGGNPLGSINSCIGATNNASPITLQNISRRRNTSQDNQRSNSQHHVNGSNSPAIIGNSSCYFTILNINRNYCTLDVNWKYKFSILAFFVCYLFRWGMR